MGEHHPDGLAPAPLMCEHVALPGGGMAIVCGRGHHDRIICDVCDKPVPKGTPKFTFRERKIDLCPGCQFERAKGDPEWRRMAEAAIMRNLRIPA